MKNKYLHFRSSKLLFNYIEYIQFILFLFVSSVQIINKMNVSDQKDVLYFVSFDDVKISCL